MKSSELAALMPSMTPAQRRAVEAGLNPTRDRQARERGGMARNGGIRDLPPHAPSVKGGTRTFTLPYPPSMNTYWRHVGHKVLISKKGREYRKAVCRAVAGPGSMGGRLRVTMWVTCPDRRIRDLDNLPKSLLDALCHAGVFPDDGAIDDLHIIRVGVAKPGGVTVTVERISERNAA